MRIVFMGTPHYATTILDALLAWKGCEVVGVFTQPDKPAGREMALRAPHVKLYVQSLERSLAVYQPTTLKEPATQQIIRDLAPDAIVVAAYGQILPQEILHMAPCINLHASLLPKYRGASPIQAAMLQGDSYTGVTAMLMNAGLDTGAMLGFSYVSLSTSMGAQEVFDLLGAKAATLAVKTLKSLPTLFPLEQKNALASYAPKIAKQDGLVDFSKTNQEILRAFRAFAPWPGIYLQSGLKLLDVEAVEGNGNSPLGEIITLNENGAEVGCAKGVLRIKKVQAPSKKPLHVKEYLAGKRIGVGALFF